MKDAYSFSGRSPSRVSVHMRTFCVNRRLVPSRLALRCMWVRMCARMRACRRRWPQEGPRRKTKAHVPMCTRTLVCCRFSYGAILGPKMAQDGPRWPQDGPKMAQVGPKMAPRWPKMGPRWPKMATRWPQDAPDGPKWPQMAPRWRQDGPQVVPGGLKRAGKRLVQARRFLFFPKQCLH